MCPLGRHLHYMYPIPTLSFMHQNFIVRQVQHLKLDYMIDLRGTKRLSIHYIHLQAELEIFWQYYTEEICTCSDDFDLGIFILYQASVSATLHPVPLKCEL